MTLCIGDKVKILNEKADGVVKKILPEKFALVNIEGFDYKYPIDHLVKISPVNTISSKNNKVIEKNPLLINEILAEKEIPVKKIKKILLKKGQKSSTVREVDLHCHEIIDDIKGMSNTRIFNYQVNYFLEELKKAISRNEKKIIFIHGKGEGVLKAEILRILKSYHHLVYYDAPFRIYGGGATLVEIH